MTHQQVLNPQMLSDIYRLPEGDIEEIIAAQGEPCFSLTEEGFLIYIPMLRAAVRYGPQHASLRQRLHADHYTFQLENTVLKVTSDSHYPSSFLLLENLADVLQQHMDINEHTAILLSKSAKTALFFGHMEVINRLADDFEKIDGTVALENFLEWRGQHVELS